ncbi:MAG TPA: hypothetical protein VGC11_01015 [Acidimicrobiia bacterium]
MEQLIAQLQEKTGLGADQIKSVVSGVMDFLGDKLPGPIADQVRKFLGDDSEAAESPGGELGSEGLLDQAKDMLGGLLGGD